MDQTMKQLNNFLVSDRGFQSQKIVFTYHDDLLHSPGQKATLYHLTPSSVHSNDLELPNSQVHATVNKQCINKTPLMFNHTSIDPNYSTWFIPLTRALGLHFEWPKKIMTHTPSQCSASGWATATWWGDKRRHIGVAGTSFILFYKRNIICWYAPT